MSRHNESTLKEAIEKLIAAYRLDSGLDEITIVKEWEKQMGPAINNRTEEIYLDGQTLYIKLSSSTLRQELSYGKERIITMLNNSVGKQLINEVILK